MTGRAGERFWRRVDRRGPAPPPHPELGDLGPCWLWTGPHDRDGYGAAPRTGGEVRAHRVSWVLAHGPIPPGRWVLHACDVPACVNPAHLFLGDHTVNMRDRSAKGRHPGFIGGRGEDNGGAKLTDEQVLAIRARWAAGESQPHLAAAYGVNPDTVSLLVRGLTWGHLPTRARPVGVRVGAGGRNSQAKLTAAQVDAIRRRYAAGGITVTALAAAYGVSRSAVGMILRGERWTHGLRGRVPSPPEGTVR